MAALLGLFWRLLREGRLKVARGRSWQPEIGMEHASRGRRSGNKGVGARWRGRFRIFSARHRSRTKVSHAENSGMTMLFFLLEVAPERCRACVDHGSGHAAPCHHRRGWHEGGWFLFFSWRLLRCRRDVDHGSGHAAPCHHRRGSGEMAPGMVAADPKVGFCFPAAAKPNPGERPISFGPVAPFRCRPEATFSPSLVFGFRAGLGGT